MKHIILLYIFLFLIVVPKRDLYLLVYTLKNIKYFLYLSRIFRKNLLFCFICFIIGIIFFPILINLNCLLEPKYFLYHLVINLEKNDFSLCKNFQNKFFWYNYFKINNIKTPIVYYYKSILINDIPVTNNNFIQKPIHGTEGLDIKKIKLFEYQIDNEIYILQEYIEDCWTKEARHFRLVTESNFENSKYFCLYELKQMERNKITSNKNSGGISRICLKECDFLCKDENDQIDYITKKMIEIHQKDFLLVPFIGWDISLTCNGPYVFEGNICPGLKSSNSNAYLTCFSVILYETAFLFCLLISFFVSYLSIHLFNDVLPQSKISHTSSILTSFLR